MANPLLKLAGVTKRFGGIQALTDVNLEVGEGMVHSIIGPNGAGKTSLFNCMTRIYRPESGTVEFARANVLAVPPHRVPYLGIARTFQNLQLFPSLSVLENVLTGADILNRATVGEHLFKVGRARRAEAEGRREALATLERFGLASVQSTPVSDLSYGAQKMVELARAVVMRPRLLLLDEPTAGLSSDEIAVLGTQLRALHSDMGLTMLIIAHDIDFVMKLSDRITVLDFGRVIADGVPVDIMANSAVQDAYLGKDLVNA